MTGYIEQLTQELSPLTENIVNHSLYRHISSIDDLRFFMEQHVFAVWDFMCLLKELHRGIVTTSTPWFPPKDALSANLISSILVEEEGDVTEDGSYASHFEIYISAMEKLGADTQPIRKLLQLLHAGHSIQEAVNLIPMRDGAKDFVLTTFSFFGRSVHELAAAFVYGREGITSSMFIPMVEQIETSIPPEKHYQLSTLIYYLKRHITLDDTQHFPKALRMLANLIGDDEKKLEEARNAALKALTARLNFLTDIKDVLIKKPPSN
jgi:hypothetical protein